MHHRFTLLAASVALLACACGGVTEPDPCLATNPDEALNCLGVPPDDSTRNDSTGDVLPESYSPLGPTTAVGVSSEFFFAGMQLAPQPPVGEPVVLDNKAATVGFADDMTGEVGPSVLDLVPEGAIWEADESTGQPGFGGGSSGSQTTRAVVATDFDADGIDEIVVVYLDTDDPANAGVLFAEELGGGTSVIGTFAGARDVAATRGDFNGDGVVELAVGVSGASSATVFVVEKNAAGELAPVGTSVQSYEATITPASVSVELAAGNLDRDNGDELAIVFNEWQSRTVAATSYSILDDAGADFAEIARQVNIVVNDQGTFTAVVADVALGDIDADGKDELIFTGIEELHDLGCSPYQHIYLALDDIGDKTRPLSVLGQKSESIRYTESSGCSDVTTRMPLRHVFVNALDVDGDGVDEVVANLRVFDDFREAAFVDQFAIDDAIFAGSDGRGGGAVTTATAGMTTADVNGDGREDIVVFAQHTDRVSVWGLDGASAETAIFREMTSIDTAGYNGQSRVFPMMTAVNVDSDGAILKYSDAEYKFVFTEPVIIAALAAAPCADAIGQNLQACSTSYGLSEASTGGVDASVSVSASAFVSFEAQDPFFGIGVKGKETVTASASFSASAAYSLEESVEYTTGSLEDTVIFTTIPLDQYTYSVVAHPDPAMVGTKIVVNLPRKPITLQVEREFYNASVAPGSFQIDESVFDHVVGDITTYPTEAQASALTAEDRGIKASQAVTVGQGGGQTTTELVFSEEITYRAGAEVSYEKELEVTGGGVGVGGSIGGSVGAGISWGSTTSTVYRGSIGSIDAANFADNLYSTGLFTYIHNHGDPSAQQFEVINYWIEQ